VLLDTKRGGLHLVERASVGDRQVWNHVLVLAAERWIVRERLMNRLGERTEWSVIVGREPQNVLTEPARAHKTVPERRHGRKDVGEPAQHVVVDIGGRHEGEDHRDVGRVPEPSIAVQPRTRFTNSRLGLRNFGDEATAKDRIHVDRPRSA